MGENLFSLVLEKYISLDVNKLLFIPGNAIQLKLPNPK